MCDKPMRQSRHTYLTNYTAVYDVEDTQGWTTLYAVQAAPNLCHRDPARTRRPLGH